MPRYSPKAARAIAFLKRSYNDVDIYVEDTANHNMWFVLIRKLLPSRVRLASINLLGGRENVVSACKLDQADSGRRKLYIIDADFDIIALRPRPRLKHLYRIKSYCIENLLLTENALEDIAQFCRPDLPKHALAKEINLGRMIIDLYERLGNLFQVYAASECLRTGVQTVRRSVHSLCINLPIKFDLCPVKIRRRIYEVVREGCKKVGRIAFFKKLRQIRKNAKLISNNLWISAKDYILPVVHVNMKKLLNLRSDVEQLKVQLANFWDHQNEPFLARRIRALSA